MQWGTGVSASDDHLLPDCGFTRLQAELCQQAAVRRLNFHGPTVLPFSDAGTGSNSGGPSMAKRFLRCKFKLERCITHPSCLVGARISVMNLANKLE